ncbi:MAG: ABC transporter substrate-binding protein [Burkholderiales bacterium]|nr:MAG: ABC transporter substrate-binding protein [Burkholderiales bacterium]
MANGTAFRLHAGALAVAFVALAGNTQAETLRIGLASEATSIDPHFHNLTPNNQIASTIFDGLANQGPNQELLPGLAVSWKPIDDLTWEFKLRQGVKFHDGSDFNADDVVCTFERAPNVPNSPAGFGLYTKGKTVVKVDDHTVHIKTEKPYPLMVNDVSTINIVSDTKGCKATTEQFNKGEATAGTGPYMFVEYVPGDRIVLKRNDAYWGRKAEFEDVILKPIKSDPARVAALLAGDVDLINDLPTIDVGRMKQEGKVAISEGTSNRIMYLHMDQFRDDSPYISGKDGARIKNPLRDVRVRKAISLAINRPAIVERVMEGQAIPAGQLLPKGFFGVSDKLKPLAYDPNTAKKLLAEAGYPDGFKLRIHGPNDRYINDAKIVEAIAQMLTRIGIEADIETLPRSVFFSRASAGGKDKTPEFSLYLAGWGAGSGEASSPLRSLIHTYDRSKGMGAANRGRHSNAEVDKVIQQALVTVDDARRAALLAQATEMAIENVAIIPLHYQVNAWGMKKGLSYPARTDEWTVPHEVRRAN